MGKKFCLASVTELVFNEATVALIYLLLLVALVKLFL